VPRLEADQYQKFSDAIHTFEGKKAQWVRGIFPSSVDITNWLRQSSDGSTNLRCQHRFSNYDAVCVSLEITLGPFALRLQTEDHTYNYYVTSALQIALTGVSELYATILELFLGFSRKRMF